MRPAEYVIVDSLEQGLFSTKYKVFCRGVRNIADLQKQVDKVEDFRNQNDFFLLVDQDDATHYRLTRYLNTNVLSRSAGIIFEKIMAVTPDSVADNIPHYFTIDEDGMLEEISESQLNTYADV